MNQKDVDPGHSARNFGKTWEVGRFARGQPGNYIRSIGILFLAGALLYLGLRLVHKSFDGPQPVSPHYARALLNDCADFRVVDSGTRQAVAVTRVVPGNPAADEEDINRVYFQWRWESGPWAKDAALFDASAVLGYSHKSNQWFVGRISSPEGYVETDACGEP